MENIGPFSHERNKWRRRDEETIGTIFDYSVTDPGNCFSRRKNHESEQKTRTIGNFLIFKERRTEIRRRNKKRTSSLSERTRTRNRRFSQSTKFKS